MSNIFPPKHTKYSFSTNQRQKPGRSGLCTHLIIRYTWLTTSIFTFYQPSFFFFRSFSGGCGPLLTNCYLSAQLVARFSRCSLFCFMTSQRRIDSRLALLPIYRSEDGGGIWCVTKHSALLVLGARCCKSLLLSIKDAFVIRDGNRAIQLLFFSLTLAGLVC